MSLRVVETQMKLLPLRLCACACACAPACACACAHAGARGRVRERVRCPSARRSGLQRFLQRVASHPLLHEARDLSTFLEASDEALEAWKEASKQVVERGDSLARSLSHTQTLSLPPSLPLFPRSLASLAPSLPRSL
eukprot:6198950-Pleurochrysis_carterae.AAC.1